jgi:hypothetical protein
MKEIIKKKLAEVRSEKEQLVANLNVLVGAERMLLQLMSELQTEDEEASNVSDGVS